MIWTIRSHTTLRLLLNEVVASRRWLRLGLATPLASHEILDGWLINAQCQHQSWLRIGYRCLLQKSCSEQHGNMKTSAQSAELRSSSLLIAGLEEDRGQCPTKKLTCRSCGCRRLRHLQVATCNNYLTTRAALPLSRLLDTGECTDRQVCNQHLPE